MKWLDTLRVVLEVCYSTEAFGLESALVCVPPALWGKEKSILGVEVGDPGNMFL